MSTILPATGHASITFELPTLSPDFRAFMHAIRPKYPRSYNLEKTFGSGAISRERVLIGEPIGGRFPIYSLHGPWMRDGRWSPVEALPAGTVARVEDPETGRTWALPQVRGVTVGGRKL